MAVNPIGSSGSSATPKTGATSLSSSDFLNLMINQLQHQDPLSPTDSNALLTQISQISTLQSNQQMVTSLQASTLQQSIGSAGNLIGKTIVGLRDDGTTISGVVKGLRVENNSVLLHLDSNQELPIQNVTQIANPAPVAQSVDLTNSSIQSLNTMLAKLLQPQQAA